MITRTAEQQAFREAFQDKKNILGIAGAGTGKTTTMADAASTTDEQGRFLSFNTGIKEAAEEKMPKNVAVSTFHGYFYGPFGSKYQHRSPKVSAEYTAELLGLHDVLELTDKDLSPIQQARAIYQGIGKFSMSDDMRISPYHIPYLRGITTQDMEVVRAQLQRPLEHCWEMVVDWKGKVRFRPENYIKIGALSRFQLSRKTQFVMVDEYQDTFPVIEGWLNRQPPWIRRVYAGDDAQQINRWTGAVNALGNARQQTDKAGNPKFVECPLRKSWRFGPELAAYANRLLSLLGDFRLIGNELLDTRVSYDDDGNDHYDAILCRTNAGVIQAAMELVERGIKVAISERNSKEIKAIAKAAIQLMAGATADYDDFAAFKNWQEVEEYVANDPGGSDIKVIVDLINKYGPGSLLTLSDSLVHPTLAETMVITDHTSKGLEWPRIKIWGDHPEPKPKSDGSQGEISEDETMLLYVAVTRGQEFVNVQGIEWLEDYIDMEEE